MDIRFESAQLHREGFALSLDLAVPSGSCTAIIGPSGAGKSTLLNLIAGFEPLTSGKLEIGGQDQVSVSPAHRPVTMVFQDNNLFPHLTVAQNTGLGLDPALRLDADQREARDQALAEVGLGDLAGRRPAELSGGQQSRAALARALLRDRPILLLDEPFAALGPALRAEMLALVDRIRASRNLTVLMVTHDPQDARTISDLTLMVGDGVAHSPAPTSDLFDNPTAALAAYLGD